MKLQYNPTDSNTIDLLQNYCRKNGNTHDVFIKTEGEHITAQTLEQLIDSKSEPLREFHACYANEFPWMPKKNFHRTQWTDYFASGYYDHYRLENDKIVLEKLQKNTINLKDYVEQARNILEENFLKCVKKYKKFIVLYSQGIDSIWLLSMIIKHDLLDRTKFFYVENTVIPHTHLDFSVEKSMGFDIEIIPFEYEHILPFANQKNPFEFYNYQSIWTGQKITQDPKTCVLNGLEGNSVLLHKWEWIKRIGKRHTVQDPYVTTANTHIDWDEPQDLDHDTITFIEPYSRNYTNKKYWHNWETPISDIRLTQQLPFIKLDQIDPDYVADAVMLRDMINDNVGNELDRLITRESNGWNNNYTFGYIKLEDVGEEYIKLAVSRRQSSQTFLWLKKQLKKARQEKKIHTSVLLSIKLSNRLLNDAVRFLTV